MSNTDLTSTTTTLKAKITANIVSRAPSYVDDHINDSNNPHQLTPESIGAMPINAGIVIDENYNHTDNNFSNSGSRLLS